MITRECSQKLKEPIRVAVTGAAGNIGYALCFMLAQGQAFGQNQPIILHLIELPFVVEQMKGLQLELEDGAFELLYGIKCFTDEVQGFKDVDYAILVGAKPRGPGMERKDLLIQNAKIFRRHSDSLDISAKDSTRVLVVGNPANTNAAIIASTSKKIQKKNISALTRLDHNRLIAQLSLKTNIPPRYIRNGVIWGNHSKTQFPDPSFAEVYTDEKWTTLRSLNLDEEFLKKELVETVQIRGEEIIKARKLSSAGSAANSICDHLRDWHFGTKDGEFVSMAVWSNENPYGVKSGLIFSFPLEVKEGNWTFSKIPNLESKFSKEAIEITEAELLEELKLALEIDAK